MPCTVSASRRGVAKAFAPSYTRPSATSLSVTMRRRSSAAFACIRAGISSEKSSSRRSGIRLRQPEPCRSRCPPRFRVNPGLAAGFCQLAHAQDIALPLRHRDHPARVEQIEDVARLDALVVSWQRQRMLAAIAALAPAGREIFLAGLFRHPELLEQHRGVGDLEIVPRIFLLGLKEHVAIGDALVAVAAVEIEVVDTVDALHIHRKPFETVSELARNRRAFDTSDLLEVGELRDLHPVAPAFPSEPPRAERWAFPVVFDKADVVQARIDADGGERLQIKLLQVRRRWLHDDLELVIVLQAVGVFAITAVLRPPRRLHISGVPSLRPQRPQGGCGVKGTGAHLHVIGLQDDAALLRPEALQRKNKPLERTFRAHMGGQRIHRLNSLAESGSKTRGTVSAADEGIKAMAAYIP